MDSRSKAARTAGLLYLLYLVATIATDVLGRSRLIVLGDAAATARTILASEWLFRLSFVGDLVSALLFLLAAWALYVLLAPVNTHLAVLFLVLNLGGVAVQCVSDLALYASLLVVRGAEYLNVFSADQLQAQAMLFVYVYKNGFMIAQLFYGAWLFPLGYLVFISGFLPRGLGILVMVHCAAWLMTFLQFFLFPGYGVITYLSYPLGFIAESGLTLWLLIMGVKDQKPAAGEVP